MQTTAIELVHITDWKELAVLKLFKAGVTEKQNTDAAECPQLQPAEFRLGALIFNEMAFF